jgi:hypothetical protein
MSVAGIILVILAVGVLLAGACVAALVLVAGVNIVARRTDKNRRLAKCHAESKGGQV